MEGALPPGGPSVPAPTSSSSAVKTEVKMEVDNKVPQQGQGRGGGGRGRGGRFDNNRGNNNNNRRGGPGGPHRGGGGGGGFPFNQQRDNNRRPFPHNHHSDNFDGPMNKKPKMGLMNPEQRTMEKIRGVAGPTADLPQKKFETKKFSANTRLYIGNISNEVTEQEIKDLFIPYGEVDEVFLNREKNFAFLKLDFRTNAEKARSELDQRQVKNRPIKVRFAPANVRVKVKNLSPMVSNELLELAFSVFGEVERSLVFVDEKGRSLGEGFVEFTRKNNALSAHKFCTDKCYFITSELRPVITEMGEMYEVDEGLLEGNLNKREYNQDRELVYYKARELGPRTADEGSFEQEYGTKWKALMKEFEEKEKNLKVEMKEAIEKLQTQMDMERYDYETEMLRQQLRQREIGQERQKMQWEQRMGGFGGGNGFPQPNGNNNEGMNNEGVGDSVSASSAASAIIGQLAPPPMPPQGLMQHLQGGEDDMNVGAGGGPTWEIGPFAGFNQMGGGGGNNSFGQPLMMRQNDGQRDGRFMGPPRGGGGGGPRGGSPRGRGFRGGGGGGRGGGRR